MSNKSKDGDFNLDEELLSQIAANDEAKPLSDEHEDEKRLEEQFNEYVEEESDEKKYKIHSRLKRRPELINSDIILSVVCILTNFRLED